MLCKSSFDVTSMLCNIFNNLKSLIRRSKSSKLSILVVMLLAISFFAYGFIPPGEYKCTTSSLFSENWGYCEPSVIYNGDTCEQTGFGPRCDGTVYIPNANED